MADDPLPDDKPPAMRERQKTRTHRAQREPFAPVALFRFVLFVLFRFVCFVLFVLSWFKRA